MDKDTDQDKTTIKCISLTLHHTSTNRTHETNNKQSTQCPLPHNKQKHRKEVDTWNITLDELAVENQVAIINQLWSSKEEQQDKGKEQDKLLCLFVSHIKSKLSSYKQQDLIKHKYNPMLFTSYPHVLDLLHTCQLHCCYCSKAVLILYESVCDPHQWTLDRIDNTQGHNTHNLVISCLACNLKRRRINQHAFLFTRQMVLTKVS